jgi:gamma-glutamyl hydrolase
MDPFLRDVMVHTNSTLNWHNKGVTPDEFARNDRLRSVLVPTATSNDARGRTFVSSYEGAQGVAIFATQFHPERPPYEFDNGVVSHKPEVLDVSHYIALRLKELLMRNNHSFPTPEEANAELIENYASVNEGWGTQIYFV